MDPSRCIELSGDDASRLLAIGRATIERGPEAGRHFEPLDEDLDGPLGERCGSFVTLTLHDELRGCVGSLEAARPLAECVAIAAYDAAFNDTRFPPLSPGEARDTHIEIAVLSRLTLLDVASRPELLSVLRPRQDGLLLEESGRRATFLPKVWDKIPDPDAFVSQLLAKSGLRPDYWSDALRCYRYTTATIAEPVASDA